MMPNESETKAKLSWQSACATAEKRLAEVEKERNKLKAAIRLIRRQIKTNAPWPEPDTVGDSG